MRCLCGHRTQKTFTRWKPEWVGAALAFEGAGAPRKRNSHCARLSPPLGAELTLQRLATRACRACRAKPHSQGLQDRERPREAGGSEQTVSKRVVRVEQFLQRRQRAIGCRRLVSRAQQPAGCHCVLRGGLPAVSRRRLGEDGGKGAGEVWQVGARPHHTI